MEREIPVTVMNQGPAETATTSADPVPDQIRQLGEKASEAFSAFRESEAYDRLLKATDAARDYIGRNPVPSFLYALGGGFVLGFLLKRTHQ